MPETLGAYVLDRRIGAGGMADVFLARGPNGVCVIKRPHSHLCASAEFVRMFLDEASLLAQLAHPSIARIFDLGQQNGVYYLAMEYVPGFDLMTISLEHERQGEFMSPELAAKVVADAAGALHYAHNAVGAKGRPLNIIHRDVSPHNILVSTRGEVKMIDFGVARAAKTMHRTQAGLVKGKYPYMAPEQITGQTIDCRVDVYALGLVLYELLTNARAIAGDLEVHQIENARHGRIKPVEQLRPNVPARLRTILAGALHPQPEGRYQSAAALQADLEAYIRTDRQLVGKEDLVRLFRVVAAEASHLPPEFDMGPKAHDPSHDDTFRPPGPPLPSPVPHPTDEIASHRPTDQVPLSHHGEEHVDDAASTAPLGTVSPIALVNPLPAGVHVGGAADIELSPETDQSPAHRPAELPPELVGVTQDAMPTPHAFTLPPMPQVVPAYAPPPPNNRSIVLALLVGVLVLGAAAAYLFWPRPPPVIVEAPNPPEPPKAIDPPPIPDPVVPVKVDPVVPEQPEKPEKPEKVEPLPKIAPEPVKAAVIHVTATPAMEVVVDKKSWGVTPVDVEVPAGKHTIVLQNLELGVSNTWTWKLAGGEKKDLNWVPKKGTLRVTVEPFGNIAIDGRVVQKGKSLATAEVWEGPHLVIVSNDQLKKTVQRKVDLKPGVELEVNVNLLTDE